MLKIFYAKIWVKENLNVTGTRPGGGRKKKPNRISYNTVMFVPDTPKK